MHDGSRGPRRTFDSLMETYVKKTDGCWLWTGYKNKLGYGTLRWRGRMSQAYRVVYENLVGPIPDGLQLDHLCRNPPCVNPAHLEPVTARENVRRGIGPGAINAAKTHCKHGHEFTPENTIPGVGPFGRTCKTCRERLARERVGRRITERMAEVRAAQAEGLTVEFRTCPACGRERSRVLERGPRWSMCACTKPRAPKTGPPKIRPKEGQMGWEAAMARVDKAEQDGRQVQRRRCPQCDTPQGRILASDSTFKRWSSCACPKGSRSASGTQPKAEPDVGDQSGSGDSPEGESHSSTAAGESTSSPAPDLPLHRDTVTRLDKKAAK